MLTGLGGGGGVGVFKLNLSNVEGQTNFFESLPGAVYPLGKAFRGS
jgi:hypothetical protein